MMKLQHRFVELMPSELEEGILYVSMEFGTVIHKCPCGCGQKVVTPLSSVGWQLNYDGDSITLTPSIGNWSFECQSHYWIIKSIVKYAPKWRKPQIDRGRKKEQKAREKYYQNRKKK
jgi:hypothetical protein